ncbi:hypothetical protein [Tardiphaga sp. 768_D3_N2_1]|uniref:hypothetical protein n=1 Tax=Tardiphaga sp. 768_D3_N2_1 TaxID=3240783 RepID=UPI003F8B0E75
MANIPNPNDPYRPNPADDIRNPVRFDNELQADPELAEGPASGSRVAIYALGVIVLLGAVFYGLNSTSTNPGDTTKSASQSTPATQSSTPKAPAPTNNIADSYSKPPVAPGVRDVTPSNNRSDVTTGAAPARPQAPQSAPTGTEIDSSKGGAPK